MDNVCFSEKSTPKTVLLLDDGRILFFYHELTDIEYSPRQIQQSSRKISIDVVSGFANPFFQKLKFLT